MEFINANWGSLLVIVTSVISAAAAIATITPNKTDNEVINVVIKYLNYLGLNIGKAKNAE